MSTELNAQLRVAPYFVAAVCFIVGRWIWEATDPLAFDTTKLMLYVRDVATLAPATACLVTGVLRMNNQRFEKFAEDRATRIVCIAAITATTMCALIGIFVLLSVPHVADEAAYLWQAKVMAAGHLTVALPPDIAGVTNIQYVGDVGHTRMSAFFPGSSVPLALGHLLHITALINPLLAGALVLIAYWSGRRLFDQETAAIGAVLFASSAFLLFQGASYFGHVWTALFTVPAVALALSPKRKIHLALAGALTSVALFSRPVSALAVALVLFAAIMSNNRSWSARASRLAYTTAGAMPLVALFFVYNAALTGDWLTTPHRLLLPNEGLVLGIGTLKNIVINIAGFAADATGLVIGTLVFVALAWKTKDRQVRAIVCYGLAQLLLYALYYNNGVSYGPRYLFEPAPLLAMVVAHGITTSARTAPKAWALTLAAAVISVVGMMPGRAVMFHGRGEYQDLAEVVHAQRSSNALIFVTPGPYRFPDPFYTAFVANSPRVGKGAVVYVRDNPAERCRIHQEFPGRSAFLLDMDAQAKDPGNPRNLSAVSTCTAT